MQPAIMNPEQFQDGVCLVECEGGMTVDFVCDACSTNADFPCELWLCIIISRHQPAQFAVQSGHCNIPLMKDVCYDNPFYHAGFGLNEQISDDSYSPLTIPIN
jgi:hypothetical protein